MRSGRAERFLRLVAEQPFPDDLAPGIDATDEAPEESSRLRGRRGTAHPRFDRQPRQPSTTVRVSVAPKTMRTRTRAHSEGDVEGRDRRSSHPSTQGIGRSGGRSRRWRKNSARPWTDAEDAWLDGSACGRCSYVPSPTRQGTSLLGRRRLSILTPIVLSCQAGDALAIDLVWDRYTFFSSFIAVLRCLGGQRLVGEAHVHHAGRMPLGRGPDDEPSLAEHATRWLS